MTQKTSSPTDLQILNSRIAALEQLIEVYERTVVEQTDKLYGEIAERKRIEAQLALHNQELRSINAELKALYEVSQAISRTLDVQELLATVLHTLVRTEIFPFEVRGAIFLVEGGKARLASFASLSETVLQPCQTVRPGECLCGRAVATGEVVVSRDVAEDGRHALCHPDSEPHGRTIVPLKAVDAVVGLLTLYTRPEMEASSGLLKLLSSLGSQIGIAINNAKLYEENRNFSLHDPLTGLANRRFMQLQLEKCFEVADRYGEALSIVMIDIDHFKRYNDTHGHLEGVRLLATLAHVAGSAPGRLRLRLRRRGVSGFASRNRPGESL